MFYIKDNNNSSHFVGHPIDYKEFLKVNNSTVQYLHKNKVPKRRKSIRKPQQ